MRILLTGGAGYVGSACLRWLLRAGHDALAYDDLSTGNRAAVPDARLIVGDIFDAPGLQRALQLHRSEAVLHFAALTSVADSERSPALYYRVNAAGTHAVLEALRACGVGRFVLSSTCAAYADDAPMPLAEDAAARPANVYGRSKLAAEWITRDYARAYGIGAAILRYFNAAGADEDARFGEHRAHETRLIPLLFGALLGQRPPLLVHGTDWPTADGTCVRDYVHTEDLASAHERVLGALAPGEVRVYNVGTGVGTSVLEVIAACEAAAGGRVPWQAGPRRPGDPPLLVADARRLESELGWKPRYPELRSIAASAWAWHRAYPAGYHARAGSDR